MKREMIIISGFSGAGKGAVIDGLKHRNAEIDELLKDESRKLGFVKSYTTRGRRHPNEEDYVFVSKEQFLQLRDKGFFAETNMYSGANQFYGSPKGEIERLWGGGVKPVLEIDCAGFRRLKENPEFADCVFKSIFIIADPNEIRNRLKKRGTESDELIIRRLKTSLSEADNVRDYDCVLYNKNLSETVRKVETYIFKGVREESSFDAERFKEEMLKVIETI